MHRAREIARGVLYCWVVFTATAVGIVPLLLFGLIKLLLPIKPVRRITDPVLLWIASTWAWTLNTAMMRLTGAELVLDNSVPADPNGRYVLISNHQSWTDVMLLIHVLRRERLPFPRFFIKAGLRWLPVIGFAAWVLDYPFMKRYSQKQLANNPALRGQDMETTKQACSVFREVPVTVVNFADGTRATPAKRYAKQSPYRYLLRPKAGGSAFTLQAMGDVLDGVLDMTIAYVDCNAPTMWDFVCGRVAKVRMQLQPLTLPANLEQGDYQNNPAYREAFREWMNALWAAKDAKIAAMSQDRPPSDHTDNPRRTT